MVGIQSQLRQQPGQPAAGDPVRPGELHRPAHPVQYDGVHRAALAGNGSFVTNSSGYGILQSNSTTGANGIASCQVGAFLGANVSYAFAD